MWIIEFRDDSVEVFENGRFDFKQRIALIREGKDVAVIPFESIRCITIKNFFHPK